MNREKRLSLKGFRLRILVLAALVATGFGISLRADTAGMCEFPEPGNWMLNTGQTMTIGGPGGGPENHPFTVDVTDCGKFLNTVGFAGAELGPNKQFVRGDDGAYRFEILYRGFPVAVQMDMLSPRNLNGKWGMGGFAGSPLHAVWQSAHGGAPQSPLCGCAPFIEALQSEVESALDWKKIYSDPRFVGRPKGLDPRQRWDQKAQEKLITLVMTHGNDYGTSVANFATMSDAMQAPQGISGAASSSNIHAAKATTNGSTCEVVMLNEATGCGADILNAASRGHEEIHAATCRQVNKQFGLDLADGKPAITYNEYASDPVIHAAQEVVAYQFVIDHVRDSYRQMCSAELP